MRPGVEMIVLLYVLVPVLLSATLIEGAVILWLVATVRSLRKQVEDLLQKV